MKTYGVDPMADKPTVIVRTDNLIERLEFETKRKADKKIMLLIRSGYRFDATHETLSISPGMKMATVAD